MAVDTAEPLRGIRVIVAGGATGGHTYPALTTIRTLRARLAAAGTEPDVLWVGVAQALVARVARRERIPFTAITTGRLRRPPNLHEWGRTVADAFRVPLGIFRALTILMRIRPDAVFSTGGYGCVPVGIAAWMTRGPLVLHEQILTVGLAKACVLIPLVPTGGDEQRRTARHLAEAGASRMLAGSDASANRPREEIRVLLDHPERRRELANAARQHGRPHAAAAVAVAGAIIDAAGRCRS